jgi:hypothetical protein
VTGGFVGTVVFSVKQNEANDAAAQVSQQNLETAQAAYKLTVRSNNMAMIAANNAALAYQLTAVQLCQQYPNVSVPCEGNKRLSQRIHLNF